MEDNYKKIRIGTLITNIIDTIITSITGILLIVVLILVFMFGGAAHSLMSDSPAIDPNGVTAGYEVLAKLFGSFTMGLGWVICVVLAVIDAVLTLVFLLVTIHGYITYSKMKYRYDSAPSLYINAIKRDCIFKMILNGIMGVWFLYLVVGDLSFVSVVGFLLFATALGLSIANLCMLRKTG